MITAILTDGSTWIRNQNVAFVLRKLGVRLTPLAVQVQTMEEGLVTLGMMIVKQRAR